MLGNGAAVSNYNNWSPNHTYITVVNGTGSCTGAVSAPCIELNNQVSCQTYPCTPNLVASGVFTITLSQPANCTTSCGNPDPDTLYIYNDRYRMVAALYTDSSGNIESFTQDGDTVYPAVPTLAYNGAVTISPLTIVLPFVPAGISVEAFGRCVAGAGHVLVYSPRTAILHPYAFPLPPGFAMNSLSANVAFPFRAYTDTAQSIDAVSDGASTLQCVTDGWSWHRGK
jgi:hypothetical protein